MVLVFKKNIYIKEFCTRRIAKLEREKNSLKNKLPDMSYKAYLFIWK